MENELISIIVPVYNAEKYLHRCIDSIINQTYKNIEIILVNDGSTDISSSICDKYAQIDERIKVIHQENAGVSVARNMGIDNSSGKYIMFVDSDDWVDEQIVEHLYKKIYEKQADIAICSHYEINGETNQLKKLFIEEYVSGEKEVANFINNNWGTSLISVPWGTLYKREKIGRFRVGMSLGEDTLFKVDYFSQTYSVVVSQEPLYYYVRFENAQSLSKRFSQEYFDHFEVLYKRALDLLYTKGGITQKYADRFNYKLVEHSFRFMRLYSVQHNKKDSVEYIKKICSSEIVHCSAQNAIGKHGAKSNLKAILIYFRFTKGLQLIIALFNLLKKRRSK